jgi:hypothetical protein
MTSVEYVQWWEYAASAFPAIHRLFDHSNEAKQRSQQWLAVLASVKLVHAKAAVDAMLRGETKAPTYDWSLLPGLVVQHAIDQGNAEASKSIQAYYDGPTVRCPHCRDSRSGYIAIWNPRFAADCDQELLACQSCYDVNTVFSEWKHAHNGRRYQTMAIACCCNSPGATAKRSAGGTMVFNPQRHCVVGSVVGLHEFLSDTKRIEFNADDWK